MPPFLLLRLPLVVLCEVFKSLNIEEKIKLSLCSKKTSAQINNARLYFQRVIVKLFMLDQIIRVHSKNNKDAFHIFIYPDFCKRDDLNTQQFSMTCCSTGIETFWTNHREGFLFVIQHLLKMFHCKISTSFDCSDSDLFQPTISMLFDLQVKFKSHCIRLKGSTDGNLFWNKISNKLGLVEYLSIPSTPDIGFKPVFISWPQKIDIWSSAWFTLEHLLECTCTRITLWNSLMNNKDMDKILGKWRSGGFPNLEYLYVGSHNIIGQTILGMNLSELDGKVFQTNDGSKKAIIALGQYYIEMSGFPFEQKLSGYILN